MTRLVRMLAVAAAVTSAPSAASAQTAADSAAIKQTALDYIEGWYEGNAVRMERALHPELAKRIVNTDPRGRNFLGQQGALTLINNTKRGGGKDTPAAQRKSDVRILDIYRNAGSVRVDAGGWVDYLHVAKWGGQWVIVNVLWELTPQ
jgi:putative lumazine-binding protein